MKELTCPKCHNNLFTKVLKLMVVPATDINNPTGKEIVVEVPAIKCHNRKCGHVMKELIPNPIMKDTIQR